MLEFFQSALRVAKRERPGGGVHRLRRPLGSAAAVFKSICGKRMKLRWARSWRDFRRHLPLAGRPTLVVELPGDAALPSLLFNAHADVVAADSHGWTIRSLGRHVRRRPRLRPWRLRREGAAGQRTVRHDCNWPARLARRGSVLLELVPGEEDCVGLGTLTSAMRGWNADAVVVLGADRTASPLRIAWRLPL